MGIEEGIILRHTLGVQTAIDLAEGQEVRYSDGLLSLGVAFVLEGNLTTKKGDFNYKRYPSQTPTAKSLRTQIERVGKFKTYEQKIDFWETCWLLAQEVKAVDGKFPVNLKGKVVPATDGIGQIGSTDDRWRMDDGEDSKYSPLY